MSRKLKEGPHIDQPDPSKRPRIGSVITDNKSPVAVSPEELKFQLNKLSQLIMHRFWTIEDQKNFRSLLDWGFNHLQGKQLFDYLTISMPQSSVFLRVLENRGLNDYLKLFLDNLIPFENTIKKTKKLTYHFSYDNDCFAELITYFLYGLKKRDLFCLEILDKLFNDSGTKSFSVFLLILSITNDYWLSPYCFFREVYLEKPSSFSAIKDSLINFNSQLEQKSKEEIFNAIIQEHHRIKDLFENPDLSIVVEERFLSDMFDGGWMLVADMLKANFVLPENLPAMPYLLLSFLFIKNKNQEDPCLISTLEMTVNNFFRVVNIDVIAVLFQNTYTFYRILEMKPEALLWLIVTIARFIPEEIPNLLRKEIFGLSINVRQLLESKKLPQLPGNNECKGSFKKERLKGIKTLIKRDKEFSETQGFIKILIINLEPLLLVCLAQLVVQYLVKEFDFGKYYSQSQLKLKKAPSIFQSQKMQKEDLSPKVKLEF